jgi:hypothetical protein
MAASRAGGAIIKTTIDYALMRVTTAGLVMRRWASSAMKIASAAMKGHAGSAFGSRVTL